MPALEQPSVQVIQEFESTSATILVPTLRTNVVGAAFEVIEVYDSSQLLDEDAYFGEYDQFEQNIAQSSFPSPRGNIDEVDVQEGTIEAHISHGGETTELDNGDSVYGDYGSSFLAFANWAYRAGFRASELEGAGYNFGTGMLLVLAVDNVVRTSTDNDVTVSLSGVMASDDVADAINDAVGETVAETWEDPLVPGDFYLQIISTTYGAGSSITIRAGSTASDILWTSIGGKATEYRVEAAGFRGQDDGDTDTTTPWIEYFRGEYYEDGVGTQDVGGPAWSASAQLVDDADAYLGSRAPARTFAGVSPDVPLQAATTTAPGDVFMADGAQVGTTAEVTEVQTSRFRVGTIDIVNSVYDDDGDITSRVYTTYEVGNLFDATPLAPRYAWFGAQGLVEGDVVPTPVAAALTGTVEANAALFGYLVGSPVANANFPMGLTGKSLYLRATVDGVRGAEQTITLAGDYASMQAIADDINAAATDIVASAYTDATANEQYLTLQTSATGADQGVEIAATGSNNAIADVGMDTLSGGSGEGVDAEFSTQASVTGGPDAGETPAPYAFPLVGGEVLAFTVTDRNGTGLNLSYALDAADVAGGTWALLAAQLTAGGNGTALPSNGMPNCPMVEFSGSDVAGSRGLTITVLEGGNGTEVDVDEVTTDAAFNFGGAEVSATADIVLTGDPGAGHIITIDTTVAGGGALTATEGGGADWSRVVGDIPATVAALAAFLDTLAGISAIDDGVDTVTVTIDLAGWEGNLCTIVSDDFTNMTIQGGAVAAFFTGGTATAEQHVIIGGAAAGPDSLIVDTTALGGSQVEYIEGGAWAGVGIAGATSLAAAINAGAQAGEVYAHNTDAAGVATATVTVYVIVNSFLGNQCWMQGNDAANIDVAGAGDLLQHELTGGTSDNDLDTGADNLTGEEFVFQLDYNPHEWSVTPIGDSLDDLIDRINEEVNDNIVASAGGTNTRQLVLTSLLLGQASRVEVLADTTSRLAAATAVGMVDPDHEADGSGRPNPDFYLDSSGGVVIGAQILRDTMTGIPHDNEYLGSSGIYIGYHGLRLDVSAAAASNPGLLVIDDTTELEELLSPLTTDNPLGLGLFFAKLNASGVSVTGLGVDEVSSAHPEGTLSAFTRAAEFLESEEVYAIAPLTHQDTVHQLFQTHVDWMSAAAQRGERILFFNPEVPTEATPTTVASGTDGRSTGAVNQFICDSSPANGLVAQGLNPAALAVSDGVYLEATVGSELRRYNLNLVNGALCAINTTFVTGENDDLFYDTEDFDETVSSVTWAVKIRGAALEVAGQPDLDGIAETVAGVASTYADRRLYMIFPDEVEAELDDGTTLLPAYYACAAVAGMVSQQLPQQGFSRYPIAGFSNVYGSNDTFRESLLNEISGGGVYILVQEYDGAPLICRHQNSTDVTTLETRELSITKNLDFVSKFLRAALRNFLGIFNITTAFLDTLTAVVDGLLEFLKASGSLIGYTLNSITQDEDNPDTVLIDVTLDLPYPCNYIRVRLIV